MVHIKHIQGNDEIYGQYASDNLGVAHEDRNDPTGTLDIRGDGAVSFHQRGLWDEEDTANPDEATGEVDRVASELDEFDVRDDIGNTALDAAMGMDDDEAAQWLKEHNL